MSQKKEDVRQAIIDAAYQLFSEVGYPRTTIGKIIELAKCSKGGFYHHFRHKEEVMEAILDGYYQEVIRALEGIDKKDLYTALGQVFFKINEVKRAQMKEWPRLVKLLSFPDNEIFIRKMASNFEDYIQSSYSKLFARGQEEGAFEVPYPDHLARIWTRELLWLYGEMNKVILAGNQQMVKAFLKQADFSQELLNRTLTKAKKQVVFTPSLASYLQEAIRVYQKIEK